MRCQGAMGAVPESGQHILEPHCAIEQVRYDNLLRRSVVAPVVTPVPRGAVRTCNESTLHPDSLDTSGFANVHTRSSRTRTICSCACAPLASDGLGIPHGGGSR